MRSADWKDEMAVVAASAQKLVRAGRAAGLSNEAATLAALIGLVSSMRCDGLNEERLIAKAKRAVPRERFALIARPN